MMRAFFLPSVLAMLLCACSHSAPETQAGAAYEQTQFSAGTAHNAQNSLDYHGVYKPADTGGAIVEVKLSPGGRYRLTSSSGNVKSGRYQWDASGRIVTLLDSGPPDISFFVGENRLWLGTAPHSGRLFVKQSD